MAGMWDAASRMRAAVESRVNDRPLRVAVTGLSRAGKTVFLTSLIANLLAMGRGRRTLPALQAVLDKGGEERLRGVRLVPARASTTPRFDYTAKLAKLAASEGPGWPEPTEDLAEISLEMEISPPAGPLGTMRGMMGLPRVRLELLDYPGEWLLDLPMLAKSYDRWSRETIELLRRPPRDGAAGLFLEALKRVDPARPPDDSLIREVHHLYKEALGRCRREHGLRYLQPGRFLMKGPRGDAPFMWFFPTEEAPEQPGHNTTAELLRERFEAYKADMRTSFFDTHFKAFDRQVVLVDALGAINAGRTAYEDTERAIAEIAACLAGDAGLLARWLGRAPIERVAFVATKADYVPELQRENLRSLLQDMAKPARTHGPRGNDAVSYHVAASVVSTKDGWADREDGPREAVVWGREMGKEETRPYKVGQVPMSRPPEGFWSDRYIEVPVFTPPKIVDDGELGIPHLNLDRVLADLVGDRL